MNIDPAEYVDELARRLVASVQEAAALAVTVKRYATETDDLRRRLREYEPDDRWMAEPGVDDGGVET